MSKSREIINYYSKFFKNKTILCFCTCEESHYFVVHFENTFSHGLKLQDK